MFKRSLALAATAFVAAAQANTSSASSDNADGYGPDQQVFYAGIAITGFVFVLAGGLAIHSYKEKIKNCCGLFRKENAQPAYEALPEEISLAREV